MTIEDIISRCPGRRTSSRSVTAFVSVCRRDLGQTLGLLLVCSRPNARASIHQALLDAAGYEADAEIDAEFAERRRDSLRGRPVGWSAYNTARIESGRALYHIDFGPDSLPAEAGEDAFEDEAVSPDQGLLAGAGGRRADAQPLATPSGCWWD